MFISIAEIFQHQVVEFLPKMFQKLNKKIQDGDVEIVDIISETYGGVIEFAFKDANEEEEVLSVFDQTLSDLFDIFSQGIKNTQQLAASSITKII